MLARGTVRLFEAAPRRNTMPGCFILPAILTLLPAAPSGRVDGMVTTSGRERELPGADASPVAAARVTLFRDDLSFFRETRSDIAGRYSFDDVPDGVYRLGASARGLVYREQSVAVGGGSLASIAIVLGPGSHKGRWRI